LLGIAIAISGTVYADEVEVKPIPIINIDSQKNGVSNPITVFLHDGTYLAKFIGTGDGGTYNAWNPWGDTTCSDSDGCTTFKGWLNNYVIASPNIIAVSIDDIVLEPKATIDVGNKFVYPEGLSALAAAKSRTVLFSLSESGNVKFYVPDSYLSDNDGGTSLRLLPQTTQTCQLYGVHDEGLNNSQFFTISPDTFEVKALGEMYKAHDIEALDIHPQTGDLFAASGKDTNKPAHLYKVDKDSGELTDIGTTGLKEIDGLSFHPDGTLWGWSTGDGLVTIDTVTGKANLEVSYSSEVEDLTWNNAGTILYGVGNIVDGSSDAGTKLLSYDGTTLTTVCEELTQSLEIEALDTLPDDTLIFGLHGKNNLPVGVIDVQTCKIVAEQEISTGYNDVEGIAWPNCQ
jgi:hypothetical protein